MGKTLYDWKEFDSHVKSIRQEEICVPDLYRKFKVTSSAARDRLKKLNLYRPSRIVSKTEQTYNNGGTTKGRESDIANLTALNRLWKDTDQVIIKRNIKRLLVLCNTNYERMITPDIIKKNTAISYLNESNDNKPIIFNLQILAAKFDVDIFEFFKK